MKYFGESWNAPVCEVQVPTPVGKSCIYCDDLIGVEDQGLFIGVLGPGVDCGDSPVHRECFLRQVIGSVGHLKKTCSCYGGNEEDPEGMTKREAAIAACELYELQFSRQR